MTVIYVDADACPVKAEAIRVAERRRVRVAIVSNGGIRPDPSPLVDTVIVPEGPDAADDWIAARAGPGDVVVTADIPLAARVLASGARALRPDGSVFDSANIGAALATRQLLADLRGANPLAAGGGGKPFGKADRSRFLDALDRALTAAARG